MIQIGKIVIFAGIVLIIIGSVLLLFDKVGIPFGRLPGDIVYRKGNTTVYFPIVTSLLVSILLTILFWLFRKLQ